MKSTTNIKKIVYLALLVALQVVLERFLAINNQFLKIGFGFIPMTMAGVLFGPFWGALEAAAADIVGTLLFPTGAYFPGFTLTAIVAGLIYGFILHNLDKREYKAATLRAFIASLIVVCLVTVFANTLMISILYNKGFVVLLPSRLIEAAERLILETVLVPLISKKVCPTIRKTLAEK